MKPQSSFSNNQFGIYLRSIWGYSATQTTDAAYIIGGRARDEIRGSKYDEVVRFKDELWQQIGNLKINRPINILSITIESETLIIGEYSRGDGFDV